VPPPMSFHYASTAISRRHFEAAPSRSISSRSHLATAMLLPSSTAFFDHAIFEPRHGYFAEAPFFASSFIVFFEPYAAFDDAAASTSEEPLRRRDAFRHTYMLHRGHA
jgi:hypothetical protein